MVPGGSCPTLIWRSHKHQEQPLKLANAELLCLHQGRDEDLPGSSFSK